MNSKQFIIVILIGIFCMMIIPLLKVITPVSADSNMGRILDLYA